MPRKSYPCTTQTRQVELSSGETWNKVNELHKTCATHGEVIATECNSTPLICPICPTELLSLSPLFPFISLRLRLIVLYLRSSTREQTASDGAKTRAKIDVRDTAFHRRLPYWSLGLAVRLDDGNQATIPLMCRKKHVKWLACRPNRPVLARCACAVSLRALDTGMVTPVSMTVEIETAYLRNRNRCCSCLV